MVAEISSVLAAVMSCVSAYFAMVAATVNTRHWWRIKRKKHDLIFVVSDAYATWNFSKIQADMIGILPDEQGKVFSAQPDGYMQKLLNSVIFSYEIVDAESIIFGDIVDDTSIKQVVHQLMPTKWFSMVDYTYQGKKRLKYELRKRG